VAGKRRWAATVPSMPTARVHGITMYYEQHGAGEPLPLINGLGADITLLAPFIAWFARSYRVVAFDNRGAGRTDKPDAPYTIELMAKDTAALMDALSLQRANVLDLALSCPNLVGRLVLVSTSAAGRGRSPCPGRCGCCCR
jgi:3-oxoadipate enol-lactonase